MVEGNSGVTVEEKNSKNISPMISQKPAQKKMLSLYVILMGLEFRLKGGETKEFVKDEAMSS